jgi:hypothetical protein
MTKITIYRSRSGFNLYFYFEIEIEERKQAMKFVLHANFIAYSIDICDKTNIYAVTRVIVRKLHVGFKQHSEHGYQAYIFI